MVEALRACLAGNRSMGGSLSKEIP